MKRIIMVMLIVLLASFVYADGAEICDYILNHDKFSVGEEIPDKVPYSNEVANFYTIDGDVIGHMVLEDKIVIEVNCTETTEPTYNVYILNLNTIKDIEEAESPVDEVDDKISEGEIIIEGTSFGKKAKALAIRSVIKIISWFV